MTTPPASAAITKLLVCLFLLVVGGISSAAPRTAVSSASASMADLNAWTAVRQMSPGINIGNTFENTTAWETGWGNPVVTKEYIQSLARLGFKTVRLPVAWDTFAKQGRISSEKLSRVGEVVDWITDAGMFCVLNIHWDGGWIDSDKQEKFPKTFGTFSPEAETKFRSYWEQIAQYFAARNGKLIFEGLNEESNFSNEGSPEKAYATLTRVNQLFIDTVRKTGGNNANRLLIIAGYATDITKTCRSDYQLPKDTLPGKLFLSIHYYTPWQFVGLNEDASWGKMMRTWGSPEDIRQLDALFDTLNAFCISHHIPAFIGEFAVVATKEPASRIRWMSAVANAAVTRNMVPVLWDTGTEVSRHAPYGASDGLLQMLRNISPAPAVSAPAAH